MKPKRVFRIGSISASVFANEIDGDDGKRKVRNVNLQRRYRDGDEWKSSSSFGLGDIPQAMEVLRLSLNFVAQQEAGIVPEGWTLPPGLETVRPWTSLTPDERVVESRKMELYAAMVENLDDHIGRLMAFLSRNNTRLLVRVLRKVIRRCSRRRGREGME